MLGATVIVVARATARDTELAVAPDADVSDTIIYREENIVRDDSKREIKKIKEEIEKERIDIPTGPGRGRCCC